MPLQFIRHRINTASELLKVDPAHGVEIDIRSDVDQPGRLHLSHDPWQKGEDFEHWLSVYATRRHAGPIAVNTKEDLLEDAVLEALRRFKVTSFFFVDTPLPTLVRRCWQQNEPHFAVRLSLVEKSDQVSAFEGKADWVWVDCFDRKPVGVEEVERLAGKFKICLVSPELHGGCALDIEPFRSLLPYADAICTKDPSQWNLR